MHPTQNSTQQRAFYDAHAPAGIEIGTSQQTKTKSALEFFSAGL